MKKIFPTVLFLLILLLSIFMRSFRISRNPPALFSDEVDAAYQAFVFNRCQSDYYGNKFPIHFKSMSDYRTPALIYLISLSQHFFGINNFSARFPSLFFGCLIPLVFYLIGISTKNKKLAFSLFFVSAVNPWLIHYSRSAFEVSGMLFFIFLSILNWQVFLTKKNIKYLFVSLVSLLVSTYFYSTAKLAIIFMAVFYFITCFSYLKKINIKRYLLPLVLLFIIFLPMAYSTLKGQAGYRFSYISIFSDPTISSQVDHSRYLDIKSDSQLVGVKTPLFSKIFHNKYLSIFKTFLNNYLKSFSTDFLFISGDSNLRHGFRLFGYFYPFELLLLLLGLYICFRARHVSPLSYLFLFLLLIAPIPYSLTRDSLGPHATRLILLTLPILYFIGLSLYYIFKTHSALLKIIILSFYIFSISNFYYYYQLNYPHLSASSWHTGISKSITKLAFYQDNYHQIYFSNKYEPALFFYLYQTNLLPYSQCNIFDNMPFVDQPVVSGYHPNDKYYFGNINWTEVKKQYQPDKNSLYVISETELNTVTQAIAPLLTKPKYTTANTYESEPKFIFFEIVVDDTL